MADMVDGVFCPSAYHLQLVEPEPVRSLGRVVSFETFFWQFYFLPELFFFFPIVFGCLFSFSLLV